MSICGTTNRKLFFPSLPSRTIDENKEIQRKNQPARRGFFYHDIAGRVLSSCTANQRQIVAKKQKNPLDEND
ncbi:unnamed protein product [Amoebophrya sp. A120]|nr:unnamed protein product [Amoebophrya sp. A120]|eukprot:GSA120T00025582001.1